MGSWEALSPRSMAVSSFRTWSLETLNNSWPDSSAHLEEQWPQSCEFLRPCLLTFSSGGRGAVLGLRSSYLPVLCLPSAGMKGLPPRPAWSFGFDCRCYCFECMDILVGPGTSERIHAMDYWACFLCLPFARNGLLLRRRKWRQQLKDFQLKEKPGSLEVFKTVPAWKREPIRVLSLFGDIRKELTSLGFLESGSGSEEGKLKYLDDVTDVVRRDVSAEGGALWEAPDSCTWYMYQFHRILQYAQPNSKSQQPFFWMFADNLLLSDEDVRTANRFFEFVILQDVCDRVPQNAVRVWSNIPALRSRHMALTPEEEESLKAQVKAKAKLAVQGPPSLVKNCFLPLREYFKYFSENSLPPYP
uniref:DNMT3 ADD domain-containing protein n=1 Tax=Jaculus jaculus TaxID=51337 RepID=A0A8C5KQH3_JACJA